MAARCRARGAALALAALLLAAAAGGARGADKVTASALDSDLHVKALSVDVGGEFKVTSFRLEGDTRGSQLDLQRFEVWAPDAVIEVQAAVDAPPQRVESPVTKAAYFKGSIVGHPGSTAMLSVLEDGRVSGMAFRGNASWAIGKDGDVAPAASLDGQPAQPVQWAEQPLTSKRAPDLAQSTRRPFTCSNSGANFGGLGDTSADEPAANRKLLQSVVDQKYQATIAFETDGEYWNLFKNQDRAIAYIGSMMGYSDLVYSREIGVDMVVGYVKLWSGGPNSDPWTYTDDTGALLDDFGAYWNKNMQNVPRTTAHFLSGMDNGGGVAWMGVLCDYYRSKSNNNAYGYTGSIQGDFSWDGIQGSNPRAVTWDISSVMHEIGHNFNSPHTHDYCNIGGNPNPVDQCVSGCKGAAGLPSCSSKTPFFNGGAGTLMSYCHMVRGGDNNVAMTFGQGHTCGVAPERVPQRMKAHVASMAAKYPQCLKAASGPSPSPSPPPPKAVASPPPPKATPSPSPSPPPPKAVPSPSPSPPPPKAAGAGTWTSPIPIDKLPYLGPEINSFQTVTSLPTPCNFLSVNRPVVVYRWFSGGLAGSNLTVSTCANIDASGDAVVTVLSSPNAAGGSWKCVGGDDDGCGVSGGAFKMTLPTQPQTYYFIGVAPYSSGSLPTLRLSVAAQAPGAAPSPPLLPAPSPPPSGNPFAPAPPGTAANGTWAAPLVVPSLPFVSAQISAFPQSGPTPLPCGYFDASRPIAVWRADAGQDKALVTISSCGLVSTGGDNVVTVLSSGNATGGPFTCIGGNDDGCALSKSAFEYTFTAQAGTYYFFAVAPYSAATPISFRINITAALRPGGGGTAVPSPSPSPPPPASTPSPPPPAAAAGTWSNPITIAGLPFTSQDISAFASVKAPIKCAGLPADKTYPVVVFRWYAPADWARGSLTASSCGALTSGDPAVAILATDNPAARPAVWNCVGGNDDGCGNGSLAFNLTIPSLTANRWYYIAVAPYSATDAKPRLRLSVTGKKK